MNKENKDIALETFLTVSQEIAREIPMNLLQSIYNILLTHQFDRDTASSLQEIMHLINEYVERNPNEENGERL